MKPQQVKQVELVKDCHGIVLPVLPFLPFTFLIENIMRGDY